MLADWLVTSGELSELKSSRGAKKEEWSICDLATSGNHSIFWDGGLGVTQSKRLTAGPGAGFWGQGRKI